MTQSRSDMKCTKVIRSTVTADGLRLGRDNQGKQLYVHRKCNKPACEYTVGGMLAEAKAVLCVKHKLQADREAFVSRNGYPAGKIGKDARKNGYTQQRLDGTGVK